MIYSSKNMKCSTGHHSAFSYDKIYQSLKRSKAVRTKTVKQSQHRGSTAPEEIKWGCHQLSCSCSHTHRGRVLRSLKKKKKKKTCLTCGIAHLHRKIVSWGSYLRWHFSSTPHTPPAPPSSVPRAAAALTEGLCQFPSDCHSHFCLYYQQCTGALPTGRAADLYLSPSTPGLPWTWLGESRGKDCALEKGSRKGGGGGWEGREKRKKKPTKKRLGRKGGGPEGGAVSKREQTEME